MLFLKQNLREIIIFVILFGLYFWHSDPFFLEVLIYGMGLYLIVTKITSRKILFTISIIIWTSFILLTGAIVYVNYWLPHGSYYSTEMNTCEFGDGPCREIYEEDLSNLDIQDWAKFLREDGLFYLGILLFAGIVISGNIPKKAI